MANLLSLPVELLQAIVVLTIPEDVESVALACKTLFYASQIFLPEHNRLRRQYHHFRYDHRQLLVDDAYDEYQRQLSDDNFPGRNRYVLRSSLELLVHIAQSPVIQRYIQTADFRYDSIGDEEWYHTRTIKKLHDCHETRDKVLSLMRNSPYLSDAGIDVEELLQAALEAHDVGYDCHALQAFLLTLLPNVTELALPWRWKNLRNPYYHCPFTDTSQDDPAGPYPCWRLLDVIVNRANHPETQPNAALAKLKTIRPIVGPSEEEREPRLMAFVPFLSLPNVTTFSTTSCSTTFDGGIYGPFETRYDTFCSHLEVLYMRACCISNADVAKFLAKCPKLRVFKLSLETKWHYLDRLWDAGHFIEMLENTASSTLEELSIAEFHHAKDGNGIASLRAFKNLKRIEIGAFAGFGPPADPRHLYRSDESVFGGSVGMLSLLDIMPESAETIVILSDEWAASLAVLEALFRRFTRASGEEKLPNLQRLEVRIGSSKGSNDRGFDIESPRWGHMLEALKSLNGEVTQLEGMPWPVLTPEEHRHIHDYWYS